MTPDAGLFVNTFVTRVVFLFTIALLSACGQSEKPVKQEVQTETAIAPLAVREWYPSPKHMTRPQGNFPSPQNQQSAQMHSQQANQTYVQSQPWGAAPQQPAYVQPPPVIVFQGQEYVPAQPHWNYQQPVTQSSQSWHQPQQPYAAPGSQYVQRPWGNATATEEQGHSNFSQDSWPPSNYWAPAGMPAQESNVDNNSGRYWTVPPANYYGNVW